MLVIMKVRNPLSTKDCTGETSISCQIFPMICVQDIFLLLKSSLLFFQSKESKIRFLQISKKSLQLLSSHTDLLLKAQSCLSEGPGALKCYRFSPSISSNPRSPELAVFLTTQQHPTQHEKKAQPGCVYICQLPPHALVPWE